MREEKILIGTREELENHFKWIDEIPNTLEEIKKYCKNNPESKCMPYKRVFPVKIMLDQAEENPQKLGLVSWMEGELDLRNEEYPEVIFSIQERFVWIRD